MYIYIYIYICACASTKLLHDLILPEDVAVDFLAHGAIVAACYYYYYYYYY